MPPRPAGSPTTDATAKKIASGNAARRREQEAMKQREEAFAAAEPTGVADVEEVEDPDALVPDPLPSKAHYAVLCLVSAFFISLPMGEEEIDWVQVAAFTVVNIAWVGYFHRATLLHGLVYFLLNFILVQWSVLLQHVPQLIESVDPVLAGTGVGANVVVALLVWYFYVRTLPAKQRLDAWDWILCVQALGNVVVLVGLGVVPMRVVYQVFKTLTGVLSGGSVGGSR